MKKEIINKYLPYVIAIICFLFIAIGYCYPLLEGKVLNQADMINTLAMQKESHDFYAENGYYPWWTNSLFSGMPTFQIGGTTTSSTVMANISNVLRLFFSGELLPIGLIIGYLIGFFVLLRAFDVNKWMSIVGSIAISFSSYFFIILAAGHITKMVSIAFVAPIIAGFILIFKKKYLWGICLTMLYTAIGVMPHPQMSFYYFMMIGVFGIAEIWIHVKEKRYKDLIVGILIFAASFGIGIGTNYYKLWANSEYVKETMRGGHSELSTDHQGETLSKTSGLSLEYATQWSYGIDETMTLMIPNFKGGASDYSVGTKSNIYETMVQRGVPRKNAADFCQNLPMYWGDQPFTSGPVYVGAIVCFLFMLGLFIVKGPYKWAILVATIFSIMLSWGNHFMGLTELFFKYFPMYSKFRAVSSILVVAEVSIPLLGFLAIKTIMDKTIEKKKLLKTIYYSAGITAGMCLIFALFGKVFYSFTSANDAQMFAQLPDWLSQSIVAERASMFKMDAWRSLIFIVLGSACVWLLVQEKIKTSYFVIGLGLLILFDMGVVNKRFFGDKHFVSQKQKENTFEMYAYEKQILQDKDPYFRVLNLTTNTFNDARTSYYLKSIGGYHGAKLRRYQDIIDRHISKNNFNVLNMLNTKYFIVKGQNGQPVPQLNPMAMGNAWFVDSLFAVPTPDEESEALRTINFKTTAVTDTKFERFLENPVTKPDSTAKIVLTKYAADVLEYQSFSNEDKTAVFSDVYYPYGWNAYIDGQPIEHFRVNYLLRALNIPKGEHQIRFEFRPDCIYKGDKISMAFVFVMFGFILFSIGYALYYNAKHRNKAIH